MKTKIKEESNQNSIELDLLEDSENNDEQNLEKKNKLIYGNDINIKKPKRLGNLRAFFYINDYPLIAIGPNCNKFY